MARCRVQVGPLSCGMTGEVMMGEHIISRSCRRRRVIFNGKEIQFFAGRGEGKDIFSRSRSGFQGVWPIGWRHYNAGTSSWAWHLTKSVQRQKNGRWECRMTSLGMLCGFASVCAFKLISFVCFKLAQQNPKFRPNNCPTRSPDPMDWPIESYDIRSVCLTRIKFPSFVPDWWVIGSQQVCRFWTRETKTLRVSIFCDLNQTYAAHFFLFLARSNICLKCIRN